MQIVSDAYKAYMSQPVRPPFHMEITVHTDTPIVYTDNEIFEFEEKKTAHPIGAELPTIEVSFKVDNIAGDYNADSPSGLYEQLIKGVKVTYRYGLEIPNVMPYGYPADEGETEEPIYGTDPLNPYGFSPSSTIEWMDGGEVYTTGEISYDKTSATIEAVDALSFLEETADVAYGTINRKQCAQFIIDATEYPEDLLGAKKISIDNILETWNTNVVSDKNAKQVLQSLAHASGVQIYIDRSGYLHLDKIPITTGAVDYHVTLGDQDEDGEFTKGKTARKVVVKVNTKNVVPEVSETINPRGEDIFVENDFVQTTLQAEVVLPWVKRYLAMRNTAEIEYAGDPSLDILDIVLLDTEYSENIPATIVESTIRFDGSITGSLVLRYDSALADNTTVKITGAENFIYSGETPSPASVTLVCETDMTSPSYEWSYFNDSSSGWQVISGATTANLTILADSAYIVGSNPTSFRVVVTGDEGTKGTTVRIQRVQEAVQQGHTYLGKLTALPSAYDVGDYFLVSTAFSTYGLGDVVQWDGDSWEVTTNPTLIVSVYQDALTLSMPLENTSAVNQYIRSIQTKQILLSTDTPIMFFYEDDTPYDGGQVATITATRRNVIGGINWYINGDLVPDYDEDTIMVYDTDMSGNEIVVTAVSVEYASVNAVIKIAKKKDRKLDASNLGLITNGDPTPTVGKEGAPLVAGDYFMWGNPTTSTPDVRKKGAVYIYQTNGTWLEDTEGTKTMSMFAQFAELPNDTDSSVMGNTIIKNLVAIKAFIENLDAENITAGTGNGTTGGFRFRAKSRTDLTQPYNATTNPSVFDVYKDDKMLFKVDVENGKVYFGENFWYDPTDKSIHTPNDRLILNANGQFDGSAIQFINTINAGFLQPWETALFPNTSPYILDFINETPLQMANKLDSLFTTYATSIRPSYALSEDAISDGRNGMILFYCSSENNDTMQLYNSVAGIVECGMSHYIERYATSWGFIYEIGTVTTQRTGVYRGGARVFYNSFLVYNNSSGSWSFPIDPFRDFTKIRILGISSYTDIIGDVAIRDTLYLGDSSRGSNGYTTLPNGLLLQWGAGTGSISFPISFSTVYRVVCCPSSASTTTTNNNVYGGTYPTSITNSGFLAWQWHNNGDSQTATSAAVFYVAIGV